MLNPYFVSLFIDWLREDTKGTWAERGIRDDAPESAKEAYARYLEIEEDAKKTGAEY